MILFHLMKLIHLKTQTVKAESLITAGRLSQFLVAMIYSAYIQSPLFRFFFFFDLVIMARLRKQL